MPHVITVKDVDFAPIPASVLAATDDQVAHGSRGQIRQQRSSPCAKIHVGATHTLLVYGSHPVRNGYTVGSAQLEERVAEIRIAVVLAVAGDGVEVSIRVEGGSSSGHPDTAFDAVRSSVEYGRGSSAQIGFIEGYHPTVIGAVIGVGAEADVDSSVYES